MQMLLAALALTAMVLPGVSFAAPAVALLQNPSFGLVFAGSSGREFVLNTDGSISGASAGDYISGASEGLFSVTDDAPGRAITISLENVVETGGISLVDARCNYGPAEGDCYPAGYAPPGSSLASTTLAVGLTIVTDQAHGGGDAPSISMDLTITYP